MYDTVHNKIKFDSASDFYRGLSDNAKAKDSETGKLRFDSAAGADFVKASLSAPESVIPKTLEPVFDEAGPEGIKIVTRAIMDGAAQYKIEHGCEPPADVLAAAFDQAFACTQYARERFAGVFPQGTVFDSAIAASATNAHSENQSLQPNRAVVATLYNLSDAMPAFAINLPTDIASNEAKLAIFKHQAISTFGSYTAGDPLDGIYGGGLYSGANRYHTLTLATGHWTGKVTSVQTDYNTSDQTAGTGLRRGTANIYVNGILAATEVSSQGSGSTSAISGSVALGSTTYTIAGTVNPTTGAFDITDPTFPGGTVVIAEGFIDYETYPALIPEIGTEVDTYRLFATENRWVSRATPNARTQMSNELGLDPLSESMVAGQRQYMNQNFYIALRFLRGIAALNTGTFDFAWPTFGTQKTRAWIWQDFWAVGGAVDQQMSIDSYGTGAGYMFVSKNVAAQLKGLPTDLFTPSGITTRPGIYRVGTWANGIETYYVPTVTGRTIVAESGGAAEIMLVGKPDQAARSPIVLGNAVPVTPQILGVGTDLRQGTAFYSRGFIRQNPHQPSARAAGLINVSNLF